VLDELPLELLALFAVLEHSCISWQFCWHCCHMDDTCI